MYFSVLVIHSWIRWAVLGLGTASLVRAIRSQTQGDDRLNLAFVSAIDLQILLGLSLYLFLSPLGRPMLTQMPGAMHDHVLRFWTIEHPFGMLCGFIFAHIGNVAAKRAPDEHGKRRRRILWTSLALLMIALTVPWPALPYGRPLLRW